MLLHKTDIYVFDQRTNPKVSAGATYQHSYLAGSHAPSTNLVLAFANEADSTASYQYTE